jgi:hypothetical protein
VSVLPGSLAPDGNLGEGVGLVLFGGASDVCTGLMRVLGMQQAGGCFLGVSAMQVPTHKTQARS